MALQDQVVSPIIGDIERQQESLSDEIGRAQDTDEGDQDSVQQRLDLFTEERQESQKLLKALKKFRGKSSQQTQTSSCLYLATVDILVDEKETQDRRKDLKRNPVVGQSESESDLVIPRKRAKQALPLR